MRAAPQGGIQVQETLDMVLTTAAMDQAVSLLFLDDGVFQLLAGQCPDVGARKQVAPMFQALPIYDVEELWVERESLEERGLDAGRLMLPVQMLARADVAAFLSRHDIAVSC